MQQVSVPLSSSTIAEVLVKSRLCQKPILEGCRWVSFGRKVASEERKRMAEKGNLLKGKRSPDDYYIHPVLVGSWPHWLIRHVQHQM